MDELFSKLTFTSDDAASAKGISKASARVWCSRKTKARQILRLRNNLYIHSLKWQYLTMRDRLLISNRIQVPSYISLSTALSYYELTDQIYRFTVENIALKRSILYRVNQWEFRYMTINPDCYRGFSRHGGLFIALPEKALADIVYLSSLGKYAFDFSALDWDRINQETFQDHLRIFPEKTRKWWGKNGTV